MAAPTRVVCMEVYEALKESSGMPSISLEIAGSKIPERNSVAKVKIIPHEILLQKIEKGQLDPEISLVIVDEYHVANAATIAALKILMHFTTYTGLHVYCLSATTSMKLWRASNRRIRQVVFSNVEDVRTNISERLGTKKGLVIIPSGNQAAQYVGDLEHVLLTRNTFSDTFTKAKSLELGFKFAHRTQLTIEFTVIL